MSAVFPDLRRPQYPSSPEVLLSALAWSVVPRAEGGDKAGLIYERFAATKGVIIQQTKPSGSEMVRFGEQLSSFGVRALGEPKYADVAEAVATSLNGIRPLKGKGRSSSAIGIAPALLQDPVGGLSAENPPNFAQLINTIYALGGPDIGTTAAERWFEAARHHASQAPLSGIERALATGTLAGLLRESDPWPPTKPISLKVSRPSDPPPWWLAEVHKNGYATPFQWFRVAWDRLCSPDWHERLPARRWASWAICVLRHGLAFTFLWEANFFTEIARGVASKEIDSETLARWAMVPVRPLVPYRRGSVSEMNVGSSINKALAIGLACREAIEELIGEEGHGVTSLAELVDLLRKRAGQAQHAELARALTGPSAGSRLGNLQETVRYSLLARTVASQGDVDHYGMLKTVNRNYTHVLPGAEWIVVMAAMAAPRPDSVVRLGDVMQSIKALGFQPRIDFLLAELERAGLCASSPDGDEGIEINLGFGRG